MLPVVKEDDVNQIRTATLEMTTVVNSSGAGAAAQRAVLRHPQQQQQRHQHSGTIPKQLRHQSRQRQMAMAMAAAGGASTSAEAAAAAAAADPNRSRKAILTTRPMAMTGVVYRHPHPQRAVLTYPKPSKRTTVNATTTATGTAGGKTTTTTTTTTTTAAATAAGKTGKKAAHKKRTAKTAGAAAGKGVVVNSVDDYLATGMGWRKKCLYSIVVLLALLVATNLVLTLWILKVMNFTIHGMGLLKIVPGGIQLNGQAVFMDMLRASTIRSRPGHPLKIESARNFTINTRDDDGKLTNRIFLGHDRFECLAKQFRINDTNGRTLFAVNRSRVTVGAHSLRIEGEGGASFRGSVQTRHVRAEAAHALILDSPTREMSITAAKDITVMARGGGMEMWSLRDLTMKAHDGSLRFETSKIFMPNLRTAQPSILGPSQPRDHNHRVFQLCACGNGKLFLAAPHSICAGDDLSVCR
ncbi:Scgdelta [Drosophila busckii]|uniref:Scgdelta n=1 Tax=Drosophila busckii TaxID=30019 RepID=A0A0M4F878_DROBS|nr:delta-sarcoglycan [Drosophila busckii]ALC48182.1 Scgdelta [Drosophila busckii]